MIRREPFRFLGKRDALRWVAIHSPALGYCRLRRAYSHYNPANTAISTGQTHTAGTPPFKSVGDRRTSFTILRGASLRSTFLSRINRVLFLALAMPFCSSLRPKGHTHRIVYMIIKLHKKAVSFSHLLWQILQPQETNSKKYLNKMSPSLRSKLQER